MSGFANHIKPTGNHSAHGDPLLAADTDLSAAFEGRKTSFNNFWGGPPQDDSDINIRHDGKFWPHAKKVSHQDTMHGWRTTTLALRAGEDRWRVAEGSCDIEHFVRFGAADARHASQTISFVQPHRAVVRGIGYFAPMLHETPNATTLDQLQLDGHPSRVHIEDGRGYHANVEESTRVRATPADVHEKLNLHKWESSSAENLQTNWLVGCQSLSGHCKNPTLSTCSNKRLYIASSALRHMLWQTPDGINVDGSSQGCRGQILWTDTSYMICDPPTKRVHTSPSDGMVSRVHMSLKPEDAQMASVAQELTSCFGGRVLACVPPGRCSLV